MIRRIIDWLLRNHDPAEQERQMHEAENKFIRALRSHIDSASAAQAKYISQVSD
ncbi:hypothetical protein [Paracoccus fontiphilus]|uniref:Uncharacterized protein n=1 Tax=Paracoccus fontiphilus TaxID=1815556 RepID=A0ABV7IPY0_9RHOB|nr:hypothetical protein [Paracoccus fontiphilus]